MIAMLVLWELGSLLLAWGLARYDDVRYGNPRTYQADAVVGHGGDSPAHPSHFIAVDLNRQAIVVEFPAGSQSGALSYVVPYYILGPGGDLTPITLEFRDVTGDGKPDMVIHIHLQSQDQTFVFVNDAGNTGTLRLDAPLQFQATIAGFQGAIGDSANSDVIDLVNIPATSLNGWTC